MAANGGSSVFRNVPDVACVAANIFVTYNNGASGIFDGTSCAAPLWAGYTALVNEQAANYGNGPVGFLNPAIYHRHWARIRHKFSRHHLGKHTNANSPSAYFAVAGYDLCTGWERPMGAI